MSYTPHTWADQETITAAKLNNIEEGIQEASQSGGGGFELIPVTWDGNGTFVLSKTAQQIYDGMLTGTLYGTNLTTDIIPEGWTMMPQIICFTGMEFNDGYISVLSNASWSWSCSTLSDHPYCYIGD